MAPYSILWMICWQRFSNFNFYGSYLEILCRFIRSVIMQIQQAGAEPWDSVFITSISVASLETTFWEQRFRGFVTSIISQWCFCRFHSSSCYHQGIFTIDGSWLSLCSRPYYGISVRFLMSLAPLQSSLEQMDGLGQHSCWDPGHCHLNAKWL